MRLRFLIGIWLVTGALGASACSGKATRKPGQEPAQGGDAPEVSGGAASVANQPPSAHAVSEYCSTAACPSSPEAITPTCMQCPDAAQTATPGCKENLYGGTRRYASSCGGVSVEVHFGFDRTIWHFDAAGQLIGISYSSDTSDQEYGQQCTPSGPEQDLCL